MKIQKVDLMEKSCWGASQYLDYFAKNNKGEYLYGQKYFLQRMIYNKEQKNKLFDKDLQNVICVIVGHIINLRAAARYIEAVGISYFGLKLPDNEKIDRRKEVALPYT
eukprot:60263_1